VVDTGIARAAIVNQFIETSKEWPEFKAIKECLELLLLIRCTRGQQAFQGGSFTPFIERTEQDRNMIQGISWSWLTLMWKMKTGMAYSNRESISSSNGFKSGIAVCQSTN
jgi:hypothetical protein